MQTTYLDILLQKVAAGSTLNDDLICRARAELREIQRSRDILVVTRLSGHWAVPYTEGTLSELRFAETSEYMARIARARGGLQLVDEQYHDARLYSHVVIVK